MREPTRWTPRALAQVERRLRAGDPRRILQWALRRFSPHVCLATSFGPQTVVLMHMISKLRPETTVFYLDTGLLFPETYALRDELGARLGLEFTRVETDLSLRRQAREFGDKLWMRDPALCCHLRKVQPLRRFLRDKRAWISGIRARQTALRAAAGVVEWDATNELIKVNPVLHWSRQRVWDYLIEFDLPFNALHDRGYPSIGCHPCTRPILPGERDERAGRWAGSQRTECGIHARRSSCAAPPAEAPSTGALPPSEGLS